MDLDILLKEHRHRERPQSKLSIFPICNRDEQIVRSERPCILYSMEANPSTYERLTTITLQELTEDIHFIVADCLALADIAALAMTSKYFMSFLGRRTSC
jgi:hypothetical protein